jgi:hypothetical protein
MPRFVWQQWLRREINTVDALGADAHADAITFPNSHLTRESTSGDYNRNGNARVWNLDIDNICIFGDGIGSRWRCRYLQLEL